MKSKLVPERFREQKTDKTHPKWGQSLQRGSEFLLPEEKPEDTRTQFYRDYSRILHCTSYRRLKHKTQVFFATQNDHICTRMEHVNHVASISYTISKFMGLNTELTQAIALGHDLGHSPFGHEGETLLSEIMQQWNGTFWHEKNGLYTADKIATLPNASGIHKNLRLTYAVRDGIISHCGETDENGLFPRDEAIDLEQIERPNQYSPYTWEGCVVKLSDKIAYLGRDIEDAIELNLLEPERLEELNKLMKSIPDSEGIVNNTALIELFIKDLCRNSSPEEGMHFSPRYYELLLKVKEFNYKHIYYHPRLVYYQEYARCIIHTIFDFLDGYYEKNMLQKISADMSKFPVLLKYFLEWLIKYSGIDSKEREKAGFNNDIIYDLNDRSQYRRSIIDYIAGMTDNFAIRVYHEIISF
ncbi:MAG: HD domain-containing protein [Bacteroidales bacterium]|jgi:dGTPase|nr:HD domain-containing protein [Bacteroidales bacterium]MDD2771357.1 HD domain-containing protein [Bacteroidales bacterium]MDD3105073.1 HD domain-containing protein [Bacteroidales bacterium]MDD3549037.1 HD domain-containing protein [Bacteroidales bacterium]MDD4064704.1 HD domain-containing protein [Bacteroidales bacterium]